MAVTDARAGMPMVEHALRYLNEFAWSVFPVGVPARNGRCLYHANCPNPGKCPLVKWGTYQDRRATVEEVTGWWRRWPRANIGLVTGELSDVVVIDIDGELAQAEANRRGYDDGPWVSTGRVGGRHLYFRHRVGAPTIFAKLSGIDYRGEGGFVLLPPSLHATGVLYDWGASPQRGDPLPDLPRWIDELARTGRSGGEKQSIDFERMYFEGIPEGIRDQELFRTAAKLRGMDMPYEFACEAIMLLASKCRPPFPPELARAKVDSAYNRYLPNAPVSPAASGGQRVWRVDELMGATFAPPRWAIPEVLPSGLAIMAGRPKLGKSWVMLGWGVDIASGRPVFNRIPVQQGDVLYLALEDSPRRMQERLHLMLGEHRPPPTMFVTTTWPRSNEGGLDQLNDWLVAHPLARLVMIDTFKRFRPREKEKSNGRLYDLDYDAIAPLVDLAGEHNVAISLVFHTNKSDPPDPVDLVSGTLGLSGAADGVLVLKRERGQADAALFVTGRDVEEQELALKFERDGPYYGWTLLGSADQFRHSKERQTVIDVITSVPGMRAGEIAAAIGKAPGATRAMLFKMVRDELIRLRDLNYYPILSTTPGNGSNAGTVNTSGSRPITPITPVTPATQIPRVTPQVRPVCRACGGELNATEAAGRYQLHFDCAMPGGGGAA